MFKTVENGFKNTFWILRKSKSGNNFFLYNRVDQKSYNIDATDTILTRTTNNFFDFKSYFLIGKIDDTNLLICTLNGLYFFNSQKQIFKKIKKKVENYPSLSTDKLIVTNITADSEGNFWLSDISGRLLKFNKSTEQFILVLKNESDSLSITLKNSEIRYPDLNSWMSGNGDYIWYPGIDGVISKINIHTLEATKIQVTNDTTEIYPVCENKIGEVLIYNNHSLVLFDPLLKTYFDIGISGPTTWDLLPPPFKADLDPYDNFIIGGHHSLWIYLNSLKASHEILSDLFHSFYNSKQKEIILNYYYHLPIKDLYPEEKLPMNISSVSVLGKDTIFNFLDTLKLVHNQNFIAVSFSALNFNSNFQNEYYVVIEGQDKKWQIMGTSNNISYANLPPGHYVFRVKAYNDHNYTVSKEKTLVFDIIPAFWQTLWFKILIWIASISIISITLFWLYKNNIQKINLKNQVEKGKLVIKQKETEFEKERALLNLKRLQAQLNPHFIFNCINSIHTYILQNKNDIADKYLMEF